jgi:hypothetical protein
MLYRLLGMLVWKAGTWFLRRKYGRARVPRPLLVGVAGAVLAALLLGARSRGGRSGQLTP